MLDEPRVCMVRHPIASKGPWELLTMAKTGRDPHISLPRAHRSLGQITCPCLAESSGYRTMELSTFIVQVSLAASALELPSLRERFKRRVAKRKGDFFPS